MLGIVHTGKEGGRQAVGAEAGELKGGSCHVNIHGMNQGLVSTVPLFPHHPKKKNQLSTLI